MRANIFLIAALLIFSGLNKAHSQQDIVVNEILQYMSQGEKTGLEVAILDAEPSDVESTWIKFMKRYKAKVTSSKKSVEIFADNATIPQISANTVDVYAIATKAPYGTKLSVFVDLGGAFVSSRDHEMAFAAFDRLLREYAHEEAVRVVEEELKEQESVMKDLQKELEGLLKDKDGYIKEIEKAKALIAQRESDIVNNEAAQETKRQQIAIQTEIIETVRQKRSQLNFR